MSGQPAKRSGKVIMVGPFPPPVHGMATINAAVRDQLVAAGADSLVIDVSADTLARSFASRGARLPKAVRAVLILLLGRHRSGDSLYMSVSGGPGQLYEIVFVLCARLRRLRTYLHHHSFAYLDSPSVVSWLLFLLAGRSAVHVTLSRHMAQRLSRRYRVRRVLSISNSVFVSGSQSEDRSNRTELGSIGFMSNLSLEKGLFEFLDLAADMRRNGLPVKALLAGPFQDAETEEHTQTGLSETDNVEYVGPKYGEGKEVFLSDTDAFIFPTRYRNEAEPIVVLEAMSQGIPVIAYGRGCIPEMVSPDSGLVIDPGEAFGPSALAKIKQWVNSPESYRRASCAARAQFASRLADSTGPWRSLLEEIIGIEPGATAR
jgi:glycosyltransferase involved in cell wall biosynthesis